MGTADNFECSSNNINAEDTLINPDDMSTLGLMDITSVSTLKEHLYQLHLSLEDIELLLQNTINSEQLPLVYLNALSNEDRITASRACLLAYAVTGGMQVPRELQL